MSWSFSFEATALDFDEKASIAQQQWLGANPDMVEAHDQVAAAVNAAKELVFSRAIHHAHGRPEGMYDIGLSGHANPGHLPREGWSHDAVTVTVRQALPPTRTAELAPVENAEVPPEVPEDAEEQPTGTQAAPQPLADSAEPENIAWDAEPAAPEGEE